MVGLVLREGVMPGSLLFLYTRTVWGKDTKAQVRTQSTASQGCLLRTQSHVHSDSQLPEEKSQCLLANLPSLWYSIGAYGSTDCLCVEIRLPSGSFFC